MTPDERTNRAAMILVQAAYSSDTSAAKHWGISVRTIQNYRARLNSDSDFARLFALKKAEFEQAWLTDMPLALRKAVHFLGKAFEQPDYTPEMIHAVAGALKIMAEIRLTKEMLDIRFGGGHYDFDQQN